jgi:aryl-alcohol dehydrogenase-like predicted oxidoreductase
MTTPQRILGRTARPVSEVGFGAWAIGGTWGEVPEAQARDALHAALDAGMTFVDTADVYGDGRSERIVGAVLRERGLAPGGPVTVATKAGRRLDPHVAAGYTRESLEAFVDRSLANLGAEALDLLQLHCPPPEVYGRDEAFDVLDALRKAGKLLHYGVSVETIDQGLSAIERPGVATVQIIYNLLRQRPAEAFMRAARGRGVGVIARVPLASGVLTGKMTPHHAFAPDDHRSFNRDGSAFDVGETFSGVPFEAALEAVEELRPLVPAGATMAQFALRWILMEEAVSVVIPGAKDRAQAEANAGAAALAPLPPETMERAREVYEARIAPHVHHRW